MKYIMEYALKYNAIKNSNRIIEKSLESTADDDKMIKIISKEVVEFILGLLNIKEGEK